MTRTQVSSKQNYNPRKFIVWLFIIASIMIFAAFTSGFVVRKAQGNWQQYILPGILVWSTAVLVTSSVTLFWAVSSARKLRFGLERLALWITFILGFIFLGLQWQAWTLLVKRSITFVGNPSGSFFYVISGLHAAHIIAGLCLIASALIGSYSKIQQVQNIYRLQIASIFWHFIDILWIYLYVFLLLNQ